MLDGVSARRSLPPPCYLHIYLPPPTSEDSLLRSVLRFLGIAFAGLLVLSLAAFLALSIYATRVLERAEQAYTTVFGEVSLVEIGPPAPPSEQNAATWLLAGSAAIIDIADRGLPSRLSRTREETWSESERKMVARTLEANRPAFELLERALNCTGSSLGIQYADGTYAQVPDFGALSKAHRLVLTRTRIALANEDAAAVADGLRLMTAFTDALARESLLISAMIVMKFDLGYLHAVREALERGLGDSMWLEEVDSSVADMNRRDMLWRAFRVQGAAAHSFSIAAMEQAGGGSPMLARLARPAFRIMKASLLQAPTDAAGRLDTPFSVRAQGDPKPEPRPLHWPGIPSNLPLLMNSIGKQQAHETTRQLTVEAIRLTREQLATGSYPDDDRLPAADPWTASPYERSVEPDGSLVLASPRALEFYRANGARRNSAFADLFRWKLPP